jgi:hypothetical protein
MIRKSGYRFSLGTIAERDCPEIMLNKKTERDDDSKKSHRALDDNTATARRDVSRCIADE